jgi:outer membrane protein OmpA-like peptidoglycan-associated protein
MLWMKDAPRYTRVRRLEQMAANAPAADFVITGYLEYRTDPNALTGKQRETLDRAAQTIRNSHYTMTPIRAFLVIGHADRALRKASHEREAFEQKISQQRAAAARTALLREIRRLPGGESIASSLDHLAIGMGNHRPLVPHAASEAEMKMNRRIEIVLVGYPLSPPRCGVTSEVSR